MKIRRKKKAVAKMLTPEEKTLIDNIKSMIGELEAMEGAAVTAEDPIEGIEQMAGTAPNEAETSEVEGYEEEEEEEVAMGAKKEIPSSSETDETANSDAEERIEELPPVDEENIKEVQMALASIMKRFGLQVARKAKPAGDTEVLKAIKVIASEVKVQKDALTGLLTQLGVADAIVADAADGATVAETAVAKAAPARRPVGTTDADAVAELVLKSLGDSIQRKAADTVADQNKDISEVRKDLAGSLTSLFNAG